MAAFLDFGDDGKVTTPKPQGQARPRKNEMLKIFNTLAFSSTCQCHGSLFRVTGGRKRVMIRIIVSKSIRKSKKRRAPARPFPKSLEFSQSSFLKASLRPVNFSRIWGFMSLPVGFLITLSKTILRGHLYLASLTSLQNSKTSSSVMVWPSLS
jgi:hypothetical protein